MDLYSKEDIIGALLDLGLKPADLQDDYDEMKVDFDQEELNDARERLVAAVADYIEALDPETGVDDDEMDFLENTLKDLEKAIEQSKVEAQKIPAEIDLDKAKIFAFLKALGV